MKVFCYKSSPSPLEIDLRSLLKLFRELDANSALRDQQIFLKDLDVVALGKATSVSYSNRLKSTRKRLKSKTGARDRVMLK